MLIESREFLTVQVTTWEVSAPLPTAWADMNEGARMAWLEGQAKLGAAVATVSEMVDEHTTLSVSVVEE